jgi:cardiolipin synthase
MNQMIEKQKEKLWNIPNFFSMLRILLVPLFLYAMIQNKVLQALTVFLLASTTDILDGMAARIWHQKTKIGELLDPAADKLLMTTAVIILSIPSVSRPNAIPLWLAATIIGRDLVIVSAAFVIYKWRGHKEFPPSLMGKASTVCQMGVILCVLFLNVMGKTAPFLFWLYIITFAFTILSGLGYGSSGIRWLKDSYR